VALEVLPETFAAARRGWASCSTVGGPLSSSEPAAAQSRCPGARREEEE
jgi:hypothetical protein